MNLIDSNQSIAYNKLFSLSLRLWGERLLLGIVGREHHEQYLQGRCIVVRALS